MADWRLFDRDNPRLPVLHAMEKEYAKISRCSHVGVDRHG